MDDFEADELDADEFGGDGVAKDAAGSRMLHVVPPEEETGRRLDVWLAKAIPDISRSRLQALIAEGRVSQDGQIAKAGSQKIRSLAPFEVEIPPLAFPVPEPEDLPLDILFEDAHLAVVVKPVGMPSHPSAGHWSGTLVNALLFHLKDLAGVGGVLRPGIVHRLDKDTSGVMVVAKTDAAHSALAKMFAKHTIERVYHAITQGAPHPRVGEIETRLGRAQHDRLRMAVLNSETAGKWALTRWWTVESYGQARGAAAGRAAATFIECRLETGRTHQIRVHMAHLGAPLIGDQLYGTRRPLRFEGGGDAARAAEAACEAFGRQALHAAFLGFSHPITGEALRFEHPAPEDFAALRDILRRA
jgi:23S rRNA pseudouridine1911/1915/1917 synthase